MSPHVIALGGKPQHKGGAHKHGEGHITLKVHVAPCREAEQEEQGGEAAHPSGDVPQNHVLHVFILCAPDTVLDSSFKQEDIFHHLLVHFKLEVRLFFAFIF